MRIPEKGLDSFVGVRAGSPACLGTTGPVVISRRARSILHQINHLKRESFALYRMGRAYDCIWAMSFARGINDEINKLEWRWEIAVKEQKI